VPSRRLLLSWLDGRQPAVRAGQRGWRCLGLSAHTTDGAVVGIDAAYEGVGIDGPARLNTGPTLTGDPEVLTHHDATVSVISTDNTGATYINSQTTPGSAFGTWKRLS
jgi:hypothetical protein